MVYNAITDIKLNSTYDDLAVGNGDIIVTMDGIKQQLMVALKTKFGELPHDRTYGNRAIGTRTKNTATSLNAIKSQCTDVLRSNKYVRHVNSIIIGKVDYMTCSVSFSVTTIYSTVIDCITTFDI